MGWVSMSERELQRVEVLSSVLAGRMTVTAAAVVLAISRRQAHRLLDRYRTDRAAALGHQARGRRSNRALSDALRELALSYVAERYADFGPTLAAEMLLERHGLRVSRETLRGWMSEAGLWTSRKQRRQFHRPRLRREHFGELVQIDGSEHRWFEDRGPPCSLLVFIDDATGRLMQLRFVASESAFAYFEALEGYLTAHGRHSVFRVSKAEVLGGQGMTQFGRALSELNIEILCANFSQAKGRVERVNRTMQDRLVRELRLAGISDREAGNRFLPGFMASFNERFATPAAGPTAARSAEKSCRPTRSFTALNPSTRSCSASSAAALDAMSARPLLLWAAIGFGAEPRTVASGRSTDSATASQAAMSIAEAIIVWGPARPGSLNRLRNRRLSSSGTTGARSSAASRSSIRASPARAMEGR
jgi:transposase